MNPVDYNIDEDDNDSYDPFYGGTYINVDDEDEEPKKVNENSKEYGKKALKEVFQQPIKELPSGLGFYGDLLEAVGLQPKEPVTMDPGQKQAEIDTLEKLKSGKEPSFLDFDLATLSDDSDFPTSPAFANSETIRNFIGEGLGIGEPETREGKFFQRSSRIFGQGVATGNLNPLPALLGGAAGQTAEELGAGPLGQAAAEIAGIFAGDYKNIPLTSRNKEVAERIKNLRNLGYAEEDIAIAINAAERQTSRLAKTAPRGVKTDKAFENVIKKSDEIIGDILVQEIPGIEKGIGKVHELARDAYGAVVDKYKDLKITNPKEFKDSVNGVIKYLETNLGKGEEAKAFIKRLKSASKASNKNPSADNYIEFYKELNKMGSWIDPNQKNRLITQVKNGIKKTFESEGSTGKQLAEEFDKVNKGVQKAYAAQDAHDLLTKSFNLEKGWNFKSLYNVFGKEKNVETLQKALGTKATENLRLIAKTGSEIKDFDKIYKGISNSLDFKDALSFSPSIYFLHAKDFQSAATSLGASLAQQTILKPIYRAVKEKMLTDPNFQNLSIKALNAIKDGSPKAVLSAKNQMENYLKEQGIEIDIDDED